MVWAHVWTRQLISCLSYGRWSRGRWNPGIRAARFEDTHIFLTQTELAGGVSHQVQDLSLWHQLHQGLSWFFTISTIDATRTSSPCWTAGKPCMDGSEIFAWPHACFPFQSAISGAGWCDGGGFEGSLNLIGKDGWTIWHHSDRTLELPISNRILRSWWMFVIPKGPLAGRGELW